MQTQLGKLSPEQFHEWLGKTIEDLGAFLEHVTIIFLGTQEEFLQAAKVHQASTLRGTPDNAPMAVFPAMSSPDKKWICCRITPIMQRNNRCRLDFKLNQDDWATNLVNADWTTSRVYVAKLIEALYRDDWLEMWATYTTSEQTDKSGKEPTEDDRIRTTLMTWAKASGKYNSYAEAATQLGTISIDTRRNHEKDNWLYSKEKIEKLGGYDYLWKLYTTELRKR